MKPAALSFGLGKALLLVGALAGLIACSSTEGETPTCDQDVKPGVHEVLPNGCNQFAVCEKAPDDPAKCCVDETTTPPTPLTGDALKACLYGFGKGPAPGPGTADGGP